MTRHCHHNKKHKHSHRKCDTEPLHLNIEDGGTPGYTVTRDAKGIPTIQADNIFEAGKGVGYEVGKCYLWGLFSLYCQATGRLAQYFGPGAGNSNIASDALLRSIVPTDGQIDVHLAQVLPRSRNLTFGNLAGINVWIDQVNASNGALLPLEMKTTYGLSFQVPNITIQEVVKMSVAFGLQLSGTMFGPFEQLGQFEKLQALFFDPSFGPTNYKNAFDDFYPPQPGPQAQIETITKSADSCVCENASTVTSLSATVSKDISTATSKETDTHIIDIEPSLATEISDLNMKLKHVKEEAWHEGGLPSFGGSWAAVLGRKHTTNGKVAVFGAPQLESTVPGLLTQVRVEITLNGKVSCDIRGTASYGLLNFGIYTIRNNDYTYSTAAQVALCCGRDAVLLDPTVDIKLSRVEEIIVAGQSAIELPIFVSNDDSSYIFDLSGQLAVGVRTAYEFGKEALILNIYEGYFARNFQEFYDFTTSLDQEIISQSQNFGDSQGNIGYYTSSSWTQLPSDINRQLPQTTSPQLIGLGLNPYMDKDTRRIRRDLQDFNNPEKVYCNWNQNYAGCLESVNFGPTGVNSNRGLVVKHHIKEFSRTCDKMDSKDYIDFMIAVANTQALSTGLTDSGSSGNAASDGWSVYVPLIINALKSATPTLERNAVVEILSGYKGAFVDPTSRTQILESENVSEGYMLLAAIQSQLKWVLFASIEAISPGTAPEPSVGNAIPTASPYAWNMLGTTLLAALGGGFNGNVTNIDWTNGVAPSQIIVDAVDVALVNLGGLGAQNVGGSQPWGLEQRGRVQYQTSIFGPYEGPGATPLKLNRSAYYKISELGKCKTTHKDITFCGTSGDPYSPHYTDQLVDSNVWNLLEQNPLKNCCYGDGKSDLDGVRIKYTYETYPGEVANTIIDNC